VTDALLGSVDDDDPRRRVATALRPLITLTVANAFEDGVLDEAADRLEELVRSLTERAGPKRTRRQPDISQHAQDFFPTSPVMGMANPIAPPVTVWVVDGPDGGPREIRAEVWFDWAYEGPPTCVHGGVIAETFDEMLGAANMVSGTPGMTGTLTVRYRKPTPLRTPLRIEARCTGRDGRKVRTWAGLYHGDVLTAEADGVFIMVGPERFLAIAEGNVDNADPVALAAMRAEAQRVGAAADVPGDTNQPPEPSGD